MLSEIPRYALQIKRKSLVFDQNELKEALPAGRR